VFLGNDCLLRAWKAGREHLALHDLSRDPGQRVNLLDAPGGGGEAAARLRALLDGAFAAMERGALPRESRAFDEETKRALEAIGYTGR
jgi:hypothetical protein